jgi:hypothetical protein
MLTLLHSNYGNRFRLEWLLSGKGEMPPTGGEMEIPPTGTMGA